MWWRRSGRLISCWVRLIGKSLNHEVHKGSRRKSFDVGFTSWCFVSLVVKVFAMKFSDQFEARFSEMLTHYPTKRSVLVPTLLYAQDEAGYLSDEVIQEIAGRLELTALEVRNVISYYSMLTIKPRGKYN